MTVQGVDTACRCVLKGVVPRSAAKRNAQCAEPTSRIVPPKSERRSEEENPSRAKKNSLQAWGARHKLQLQSIARLDPEALAALKLMEESLILKRHGAQPRILSIAALLEEPNRNESQQYSTSWSELREVLNQNCLLEADSHNIDEPRREAAVMLAQNPKLTQLAEVLVEVTQSRHLTGRLSFRSKTPEQLSGSNLQPEIQNFDRELILLLTAWIPSVLSARCSPEAPRDSVQRAHLWLHLQTALRGHAETARSRQLLRQFLVPYSSSEGESEALDEPETLGVVPKKQLGPTTASTTAVDYIEPMGPNMSLLAAPTESPGATSWSYGLTLNPTKVLSCSDLDVWERVAGVLALSMSSTNSRPVLWFSTAASSTDYDPPVDSPRTAASSLSSHDLVFGASPVLILEVILQALMTLGVLQSVMMPVRKCMRDWHRQAQRS